MGENSNGLRATSTSSDRDASLSRPSTAQSTHQQDIPSFSSDQTYLQMLTKSAHPGSKSSTSSTIPSHNQDTRRRRHRHRHRHRQRSPIRRNSTRRSRSLSQPHYRTYQSYVPDFNSGGLYGPYSGTPSSRGVASSDKYRPSEPQPYCGTPSSRGVASTDRYRPTYVSRPDRNDEEPTRSREGSYVAPQSSKEWSSRRIEGSYVDPWNSNIELVLPASTKEFGRLSPVSCCDKQPKQENRNPHWGQLLKGFKQHLQRPPLDQGKERKQDGGMLLKQENKVVVMKVAEDENLIPAMSWQQRAEKIRRELRQQQTTIMM